jgi:hypothetical protein
VIEGRIASKSAKKPKSRGNARSAKEAAKMSMEFLLVTFKESRTVLADGDPVGVTNRVLLIPANEYDITLSGDSYAPQKQTITVMGTSIMHPAVAAFT